MLLQSIYGLTIFLLVVDVQSQECGQPRPRLRKHLLSGTDAKEGDWPWLVLINIKTREKFLPFCTGYLIDDKHVLTAAHCMVRKKAEEYLIHIFRVDQMQLEEYSIARFVKHKKYKEPHLYNDIAMLTLSRPVFAPGFNPICLPNSEVKKLSLTVREPTVAGYRQNGSENFVFFEHKEIPILSNKKCNKLYSNLTRDTFYKYLPQGINRNLLCAGFSEGDRTSCRGDSGSPLMLPYNGRFYAIGILSFGICGRTVTPEGYIRIPKYLQWVKKHAED